MNASELKNWLPVLQHPEYGEAICREAGIRVGLGGTHGCLRLGSKDHWVYLQYDQIGGAISAALCFGVLSLMWKHRHDDDIVRMGWNTMEDADFSPDCVLWSAYRWLGLEVSE